MASSRGIRRAQRLTHSLQLALTKGRPFSPEREVNVGSHICLLPCAMEERIVEMDRTRRSRAPSPEQTCPKELVSQQHDARQNGKKRTEDSRSTGKCTKDGCQAILLPYIKQFIDSNEFKG
ncbi:hypothetical protein HAV15_002023 [Penicillium sp. str. |nr:hypothetical protein HAV15_002023 [Penicillium sp. str. \